MPSPTVTTRHAIRALALIAVLAATPVLPVSGGESAEVQLLPLLVHYDYLGDPPKTPLFVSFTVEVSSPSDERVEFETVRPTPENKTHTGAIPFRFQVKQNGEWSPTPIEGTGHCSLESVERLGPVVVEAELSHTEKYALPRDSSARIEVCFQPLPDDWEAIRVRFFWKPTVPGAETAVGCPDLRRIRSTDDITPEEEELFGNVVTREDVEAARRELEGES